MAALATLLLGVTDLVLAAERHPPLRFSLVDLSSPIDTIVGARYLLLATGLMALGAVYGLLHGKQASWLVATIAAALSIPAHHVKEADALGLVVGATAVLVLLLTRRTFRARSDRDLARRGLQTLVMGELAVFLYGTIGLYLLDDEFLEATSLGQSLRQAGRLLFLLPASDIHPLTHHGRWFLESVRFAALAVALVALSRMVASVVVRPGHGPADRAHVERLLHEYATTPLAPFHLLDDKSWFFSSDGEAVISYKLVGTTAVALGEPIGRLSSRRLAASEFMETCALNGWVPAFHQVSPLGAEILRDLGCRALKIGEEAVVPVQEWSLADPRYKWLRSALRRLERSGHRTVEIEPPIPAARLAEMRAVSDAWLATGHHRERTFTLGRFDAGELARHPVVAVVDASGRIVAFADVLPSYASNDGLFDLMRRHPDTPNGTMDALFVALIERFRREGRRGMDLGLAPLAGITGDSVAERSLRLLYERGSTAFRYEGLRSFKDKWGPDWQDRWLCYRTDTELPRVATAVARAGELADPRSPVRRARDLLVRFPFTFAVGTVVIWLMATTAADARLAVELNRHLALSWRDLQHLQLWRLPTSQLLQTHPGWVLSNLALLLIGLPLAEWRVGSRRAIAVFFVGDWLSTLTVVFAMRLAAGLGSAAALDVLTHRDSGTSSGLWALIAAVAWSVPAGPPRRLAMAAVVVPSVLALALVPGLFAVQHLLAVVASVVISAVLDRRRSPRPSTPASTAVPAGTTARR